MTCSTRCSTDDRYRYDTPGAVSLQEHPRYPQSRQWLAEAERNHDRLALAPQVLTEAIHVMSDAKRYTRPVPSRAAVRFAQQWWDHPGVTRVYPNQQSVALFFQWMTQHRLGRKRLLDTQLAATYWTAGVRRIVSSDVTGFTRFGFEVLDP